MKCISCDSMVDDHRLHLGYNECIECSDEEKYSAHQVYPHKTGGYVQPVKSDTKKNLQRMDRRSTGGGRTAKGIFSDQSWDRWLKNYEEQQNNPKPKRKIVWKAPVVHYLSEEERTKLVQSYYDNNGYQPTLDYCMELYRQDKISFTMKTELANMVTQQQMLPKRLRKWVRKIK
jgi:hypothetical protein|tara:strand:- start:36 stop:557 length:522 start_codon:yes stop_codon:yes gene_type:complete